MIIWQFLCGKTFLVIFLAWGAFSPAERWYNKKSPQVPCEMNYIDPVMYRWVPSDTHRSARPVRLPCIVLMAQYVHLNHAHRRDILLLIGSISHKFWKGNLEGEETPTVTWRRNSFQGRQVYWNARRPHLCLPGSYAGPDTPGGM